MTQAKTFEKAYEEVKRRQKKDAGKAHDRQEDTV